MGGAAARVGDPTQHGIPLNGAGCASVLIGKRPAWRAITPASPPGAAAAAAAAGAVRAARKVGDEAIAAAEKATASAVASGVPAAIASAKAAEETVKTTTATSMSALITSTAGQLAAVAGGPPDVQTCPVPLPIPPHGPGLVLDGSTSVFIGGYAAARSGDPITEAVGPPNSIAAGEPTVVIG